MRLVDALWFIMPAYVANFIPVTVSKIKFFECYNKPIDGNRRLFGVRLLGGGKTWRGLVMGITAGTLTGLIQIIIQPEIHIKNLNLPLMSVQLAFMMSTGALFGDIVASFVKRRIGMRRGDPAPLLDQLDFVFGAIFFSWLLLGRINYDRFYVLIVITPGIHLLANFVAWVWKLKRRPW